MGAVPVSRGCNLPSVSNSNTAVVCKFRNAQAILCYALTRSVSPHPPGLPKASRALLPKEKDTRVVPGPQLSTRNIVDFFCEQAGIAIEADGQQHSPPPDRDVQRDRLLTAAGILVLRFTNEQIIHRTQDLISFIRRSAPPTMLTSTAIAPSTEMLSSSGDDTPPSPPPDAPCLHLSRNPCPSSDSKRPCTGAYLSRKAPDDSLRSPIPTDNPATTRNDTKH